MTVGKSIREARKKKKFTQQNLADKLGVSQAMIAQYENGKRIPKAETLGKIAEALDAMIYYDHKSRQHQLIASEDGKGIRTYADPDPERTRQIFKGNRDDEDDDPSSYENSHSYASSAEELDKRLEERKKIEEEAAKKAPRVVDENGNEIRGRPIKFTDKSMSFEEALAEAETEELERIQTAYKQLNRKGKAKAVERVEELTEISRYTKEDPPRDPFFMLPKNKRKR